MQKRHAFTLVELLVVVMIISILATITLFALFNAGEFAKAERTKAQIKKINDLIAPAWESYLTRRAPIAIAAGTSPQAAAANRVNAIRELMRLEFPDRMTDVTKSDGSKVTLQVLTAHPALYQAYHRMSQAASWHTKTTNNINWRHQGSECLYMILSRMQDGESNGLEHFHATEITDIDGDGMREIVDGWGKPIEFLRWAPGFLSPNSSLQNTTTPDLIDPTGARGSPPTTYALFPLVFSAGPDMNYDIATDVSPSSPFTYGSPINPYSSVGSDLIGAPQSAGGWKDNLTNHLILD